MFKQFCTAGCLSMDMHTKIESFSEALAPWRNKLLAHPVYNNINNLDGIKNFTQVHVFAVWDFMSLLKSLQIELTCVSLPWQPVGSANTRYLINEIVLGEESDVDETGVRISHFELYLKAMAQMNADTTAIQSLLQKINAGNNIDDAINQTSLHKNIKAFLQFTFEIALHAPSHVKAAVFTFGREDLIPAMFIKLLEKLYTEIPEKISTFKYYIERHIEVDGDHHSHLAIEMVTQLCGENESNWNEALDAAKKSLEMRYLLWDAILETA